MINLFLKWILLIYCKIRVCEVVFNQTLFQINTYYPRQKDYFGFTSGDMVKGVVAKGKNKGTWYGSVACRSTGSFNINLKEGRKQGINHKYCQLVQKADGYKYTMERREV
ncbi:hypothetical protein [Amphibacillus jilinensis]|uniref:hypothetical protein n=1 Tax=Amphibacillus jilinensis TaxID=1216008 RepID=UPI0003680EB1|nr:hypothetical protein [Amphibacillus jilinensis]